MTTDPQTDRLDELRAEYAETGVVKYDGAVWLISQVVVLRERLAAAAAVPVAAPPTTEQEAHRLALSEALDLGTGAPWDAICERVEELRRIRYENLRRAENAEARAAAMERAMESTAADALKHRGCHRDLMAQCLRAERAEAEVERLTADRAATLREAATRYEEILANADTGQDPRYWTAVRDVTLGLRAMAAEAPHAETPDEAHPAEHSWAAELHDPLADEWVPGTRYTDRDRAVNALTHAKRLGPTWKDGTPTQRRLVRATTTYTVEAEQTPAVVAQPGKETSS